jgi:hypothetical protein
LGSGRNPEAEKGVYGEEEDKICVPEDRGVRSSAPMLIRGRADAEEAVCGIIGEMWEESDFRAGIILEK